MGYELSIVRKNDWSDIYEDSNISLKEWTNYATKDYELEESDDAYTYNWKGYPYIKESGTPWFAYNSDGYIYTKNPDIYVIKKMISIATALKAKVLGEEGELYDNEFLKAFE